jgi:hypothetical protein
MRVHPFRLLVLAALILAVVLALAARAHAASDARLLARYQPVTRFDPLESFRPTTVDTFVADATLEQLDLATGTWIVRDPDPNPTSLPGPGTGVWRLNQQPCLPNASLGGLACYESSWKAHNAASIVYGRVAHVPGRIVVQYWYFYYDNVYSYQYPPSDFIWQSHEGDWEVVNVVLDSADDEPLFAGYSQHCLGQRRVWAKVPRWHGTHPIVRVAYGSHANYYSGGTHPIDTRCLPAQAIAILQANQLPLPVDYAFAGEFYGPSAFGSKVTSAVTIAAGSPAWTAFPGFWGENEYFKVPPYGVVWLGTFSPIGPVYHAVWQHPLETLATWPSG